MISFVIMLPLLSFLKSIKLILNCNNDYKMTSKETNLDKQLQIC